MNPNECPPILTDEEFGQLIGFLAQRGHIEVIRDLLSDAAYKQFVDTMSRAIA